MKKIGITTIYSVPNYGSVLQAFATQEIIKKLGYECQIINYKYPNKWHYKIGFKKMKWTSRIAIFIGLKPQHRKIQKLEKFKKTFFNFTRIYKDIDELKKEDWSQFYAIVVGSDQVWNPRFLKGDSAFMLSYLPDNIYRISLASSFATNNIPSEYIYKYQKYLSKFNELSVREENGITIIKNQLKIDKNVEVILDPTLLLSNKEWLNLVPKSKLKTYHEYILLYMLDYAFNPKPYIFDVIKYYQQKLGYKKVIALEGYTPQKICGIKMINKTNSSIIELIELFANANLVITSSFHGTAFAINFNKPLISITPNDSGDDRQSSLLKDLGLSQCIATSKINPANLNPFYNVKELTAKLESKRLKSINWIAQSLIKKQY